MYCVYPPPYNYLNKLPYNYVIIPMGCTGIIYICTRYIVLLVNKVVDNLCSMWYNTMGKNPTRSI